MSKRVLKTHPIITAVQIMCLKANAHTHMQTVKRHTQLNCVLVEAVSRLAA